MKKKGALHGSMTVFFSLIFLVMIAFLTSLLAFGHYQITRTRIRRDVDAAAWSTLAEYRQNWVSEYGLYCLPKDQVEQTVRFYLDENAEAYQVQNLTVTSLKTLQDPRELHKQILSFMRERGIGTIVEEILQTIGWIQEKEEAVEELPLEDLQNLEEIQEVYAGLVQCVEGVMQSGSQAPYSIRGMLVREPSIHEVQQAAAPKNPVLEDIAVLEKAYDAMEQTAVLCDQAVALASELIQKLEAIEKVENFPVTCEQLLAYQEIWQNNRELVSEAAVTIRNWLRQLDGENEAMKEQAYTELIQAVTRLNQYDRSTPLPYEYREATSAWDFGRILSYLRGYRVDIEALAPDAELDLGTAEAENETEDSLQEITTDEGFWEQFLLGEYCLGFFWNFSENAAAHRGENIYTLRGEEKNAHFLRNEIEYLIVGANNEYRNVDGVRTRLVALRTALNIGYLLTDTQKRTLIAEMAAATGGVLLPGIGNGIAFGLILLAWGWGEAVIDYQTLTEGGAVPLWKDEASWKTDLNSILAMQIEGSEQEEEGLAYEQYVRLLLYTVDESVLLNRVQTLLYCNEGRRDLSGWVTGFTVEGSMQGESGWWNWSGEYAYETFS